MPWRALPTAAPDSPEGSAALRELTTWLARGHGPAAWLDLAEELAVDLAEALDAIAAVEQRDPVEDADRWFHEQPAPDVPGAAADPGRDGSGDALRSSPGACATGCSRLRIVGSQLSSIARTSASVAVSDSHRVCCGPRPA